jgi:formyl-CoA transferase
MGLREGGMAPIILNGFRAKDGWFIVQVARENHFAKLAEAVGRPEWTRDERFATRQGWVDNLESILRPAIESWAADKTKVEACQALAGFGVAAGPCFAAEDVVTDQHVAARRMLVEVPRTDGVAQPVLVPGNPVKLSAVAEGPETRVPWLGEHTDQLLSTELGLTAAEIKALRAEGVLG